MWGWGGGGGGVRGWRLAFTTLCDNLADDKLVVFILNLPFSPKMGLVISYVFSLEEHIFHMKNKRNISNVIC